MHATIFPCSWQKSFSNQSPAWQNGPPQHARRHCQRLAIEWCQWNVRLNNCNKSGCRINWEPLDPKKRDGHSILLCHENWVCLFRAWIEFWNVKHRNKKKCSLKNLSEDLPCPTSYRSPVLVPVALQALQAKQDTHVSICCHVLDGIHLSRMQSHIVRSSQITTITTITTITRLRLEKLYAGWSTAQKFSDGHQKIRAEGHDRSHHKQQYLHRRNHAFTNAHCMKRLAWPIAAQDYDPRLTPRFNQSSRTRYHQTL